MRDKERELPHGYLHRKVVRVDFRKLSEAERDRVRARGYEPETLARVTMVSTMGDVGLNLDLKAQQGYNLRLYPEHVIVAPDVERQEAAERLVKIARDANNVEEMRKAVATVAKALEDEYELGRLHRRP